MKNFWTVGSAIAAALAAVVACSSGSNGSGTSNAVSCATSATGVTPSAACETCIASNCGSDVTGYESSCSNYLSCLCPDGTTATGSSTSCASKAETSDCVTALQVLLSCVTNGCESECSAGAGSGGTIADGGSASDGSALTGYCLTYVACCTSYQEGLYGRVSRSRLVLRRGERLSDLPFAGGSVQRRPDVVPDVRSTVRRRGGRRAASKRWPPVASRLQPVTGA